MRSFKGVSITDTVFENARIIKENAACAAEISGRTINDIRIVPATKTVEPERINLLLECGITEIGENRVQELLEKYDRLDKRFKIHFIGKLQTNKVKYIVDKVDMIHSVDSVKLCAEISKRALAIGRVIDVLIEVNIGREESKSGIMPEELSALVREASKFEGIRVVGLMVIPPIISCVNDASEDAKEGSSQKVYTSKAYFEKVKELALDISSEKIDNVIMQELSMGMSEDYCEAIECGATIVRPGRAIFGERIYK